MLYKESEATNPQGDPKDTDYQAVYQKYYEKKEFDLEKASKRLKFYYGVEEGGPELEGLIAFYESKKKSQNGTSASDSNVETDSGDATSSTVPQTKEKSGGAGLPASTIPLETKKLESDTPYKISGTLIAQAEVRGRPDGWEDAYLREFGEGQIYQLNTDKIFSEQRDQNLMASLNALERDAFERWCNKRSKGKTDIIEEYLSLDQNKDLRSIIEMGDSKFEYKEKFMNMFAALEDAPKGQLYFPGQVRKYQLGGEKTKNKNLKKVDREWGNFYRDMVKASLPYGVQKNKSRLQDLEYYFKHGNGDMFDFTEDGEIGNQTWWSNTQLSGEIGGMTFVNKLAFAGSRLAGWMADTVIGEGMGDVFREGLEPNLVKREKELEEIREKMNSFESGISRSYGAWAASGFTDLTALNNALEQSWLMTVEAGPQLGIAVAAGAMGMGPGGIALLMTADGTTQEAMMIRNDISFDDFIDKDKMAIANKYKDEINKILEERESEGGDPNYKEDILQATRDLYKEQIQGSKISYNEALSTINISDTDSQEDIEKKLKERYDIERNDSNRTWYLSTTAAVDFVTDYAMFRIFRNAVKGSNYGVNSPIKDYVKNILVGSGVALPEAAIPTFVSVYWREAQKAEYTNSDFDSYRAFEAALDATLGMAPLGPLLHTGGSSLAYTRHLSRSSTGGPDGISVYQRKIINDLQNKANDPNISSKDRTEAMKLMAKFKRDGIITMEKSKALYDYIGKKDPSSLDEIANLTLQADALLRQFKGVDDPNIKMAIKEELASIVSRKSKVEAEFKEGFEAQYDHSHLRQKFDESADKGIVEVKPDDATVKTDEATVKTDEADADPLVRPDDSAIPTKSKDPKDGDARKGDDTEGVVAEERQLSDVKGGRIRTFLRNTFRSDAGIGGNRGLRFWKQRKGAKERLGENVRGRQRELRTMENQLGLDLGVIDALFTDVKFDVNGKKVGDAEYNRRKAELKKFMNGEEARVAFLSEPQKAKLDFLRAKVDGLSGEMIRLLEENPTAKNMALIETIKGNQGQYLKRSYEAFTDDGTWIRDLNKSTKKTGKEGMSASKKKLYDDAVEFVMSDMKMERVNAEQLIDAYIVDLYDRMNNKSFISGSGTIGALDSKVLSGRKEIPVAFRKLLGEIDDVNFNYVNTVHRLSGYVADLTFQKVLRQDLLESGYAHEGKKRTGETELAPGQAFSGLDGLYVDPNFKVMYESMMPLSNSPSKLYRALLAVQGSVKIGKTVYSPTTTSRNLLSGVFLGLNSGHFFGTDTKMISQATELAWGLEGGIDINAMTRERDKLMRYGIIGDGARAGEVMGLLRDFSDATAAQRIAEKSGGNKLKRATREVSKRAQKLYAFGDDFYKTTGFYIETQRFIDSGMDRATAETRAAERIRGGYPTYSYIPRNIKRLRRYPMSGMFVSFPYEVARTTANNLRYAAQDFAEGRHKMGMQRIIGMGAAGAFGFGMHSLTKSLYDYSEEELDAIRLLGPEWQSNSQPIFLPKGDGDEIKFLDTQAILPNAMLWAPIRSLILQGDPRDETYLDGVMSAIGEVLDPYISTDATASLVMELVTNKKEDSSQPIYYYDQDKSLPENLLSNAGDISTHIMSGIGPGIYGNLAEFFKANNIRPEIFGEKATVYKEYTNEDALMALFGFRINTFDMKSGILPQIYGEYLDLENYTGFNLSNRDIRLWSDKDSQYIKEQADEYVAKQAAVAKRIQVYPDVAIAAGLSPDDLIKTLVSSGISKKNAAILSSNAINGTNLPLNPKYISLDRIKGVIKSVQDAHRGSNKELEEKTAAVMEAMFLANVMIIEKWSMQFENYDINNDEEEENEDFKRKYQTRNKQ